MLAVKRHKARGRKADAEIHRRILDADRDVEAVGDASEEPLEHELGNVLHGWWLQYHPRRSCFDGRPGEFNLSGNGDRKRQRAVERLGDTFEYVVSLGE